MLAICFLMAYDNGIVNEGCFRGCVYASGAVYRGEVIMSNLVVIPGNKEDINKY